MAYTRKKMLIVDGYNVVRSGLRYIHMREEEDFTYESYNKVRDALISDVAAFAGSEYKATIVFDAAENSESAGKTQRIGGVTVVFSPFGSSADKVIEKLAYEGRGQNMEVLVVTSDAAIQDTVFGNGVDRMSANGFSHEVENLHNDSTDIQEEYARETARKSTVASRVSPEVLAKLTALRDGK